MHWQRRVFDVETTPRHRKLRLTLAGRMVTIGAKTRLAGLRWLGAALLIASLSTVSVAQEQEKPSSIEELRAAVQAELDSVGYGSVGIALVSREGTIWADGIGIADPENGRQADANTYWRLGSISKSFVGLSALILEERGKLRLTDIVSQLAPRVEIPNRWDDQDPVRLVHLLEHTAALDELHFKDFASNDLTPLSLLQGLEHARDSLYCRWPPGQHFSYSNVGPALGAYIVQEVDGRLFEDFIADEILAPLQMTGAGMLLTDAIEGSLAAGFASTGEQVDYRHILVRPSGAMNATPAQMANFVRMLLNRGELDGRRIVSPESIARMERSETTLSAALLPDRSYGLGNFEDFEDGFAFRGHNGGMPGYSAWYGYLPDHGLGYCLMVSLSGGRFTSRIRDLVTEYLVRDIERPGRDSAVEMNREIDQWVGYYRPGTVRNESTRYIQRLVGVLRVQRAEDRLLVGVSGREIRYRPVGDRVFSRGSRPAPTLALIEDSEGTRYVQGEVGSLRQVSATAVWFERIVAGIIGLLLVSSPLGALIWIPLTLSGRGKREAVAVRSWPLLAVTAIVIVSVAFVSVAGDVDRLGKPSLLGIGFVGLSWAFVFFAAQGLRCGLRSEARHVGRFARRHAIAVSLACLVAAAYLLRFRAIGFPPWW